MKYLVYILMPLAVLLAAASLGCVVGYLIWLDFGDQFPLHKIISKIGKLFLVLSIFPVMAVLHLNGRDLGFADKATMLRQFGCGLGLGILTLLPIFIVLYFAGVHVIDEARSWSFSWVLQKFVTGFLLALLISLAEEPIFRGILFVGLKQRMPVAGAVLISSFYYGILHFLDSQSHFANEEVTFFSGFILLKEALLNVLNPDILPAFLALFMVGAFLGVVRSRVPNSLALCIGCHTAWVWQIKFNKSLFNVDPESPNLYLVSSYDGVVGPLVTVWMFLVLFCYIGYRYLKLR